MEKKIVKLHKLVRVDTNSCNKGCHIGTTFEYWQSFPEPLQMMFGVEGAFILAVRHWTRAN